MATASVKAITQDTFDSVVMENINDFEMDDGEALQDAIKQFESQGVNLSMIMKEVPKENGHAVLIYVQNLKEILENHNESQNDDARIKETLNVLEKLFEMDLAHRYQASKIEAAHMVLYKACQKYKDNQEILKCCIFTFAALLEGQPDLITADGLRFTLRLLQSSTDTEIVALLLRILRMSCTKHEQNRINFVQLEGIEIVLKTAEKFKDSPSITREACIVLRCLTLDDDVRVQFGKAHDHTKLIVTEHSGLERLFKFIEGFQTDTSVIREIYATLGKLLVRSEFCQQLVDLGGLNIVFKTIDANITHTLLIRQCVTLLKAMSGNDDVKVAVVKAGGVERLLKVLKMHCSHPQICEACFAALASLALRNPSHCDIIMANNAAVFMVEAMRKHSDHAGVLKQACMAIRNLVARTRHHSKAFIDNGAVALIRKARAEHKAVLDDQGKAALRDLDVDVELEERWKGANPGVTS